MQDLLKGIAITLSLFLAMALLPVAGAAAGLFIPLSVAFYFSRLDRNYGFILIIIVSLLIAASAGISMAALFLMEFAAMGYMLSEVLRLGMPLGRGVLFSALLPLLGSFLLITAISGSIDKGVMEIASEHISRSVKEGLETYRKMGVPDDQVETLTDIAGKMEKFILKTFPSLVFLGLLYMAVINFLMLKGMLERRGISGYRASPLEWSSPEWLVWILIIGGGLSLFADEKLGIIGLNCLVAACGIYFIQGLAIVAFYFKKMRTPLFLRTLGYTLIFLQQLFTITVIAFGLFDLWFDFRKLKRTDEATSS